MALPIASDDLTIVQPEKALFISAVDSHAHVGVHMASVNA